MPLLQVWKTAERSQITTKGSNADQISERIIFLTMAGELTLKANVKSFGQLRVFTWIRLYHCKRKITQTN